MSLTSLEDGGTSEIPLLSAFLDLWGDLHVRTSPSSTSALAVSLSEFDVPIEKGMCTGFSVQDTSVYPVTS